MSETSNKAHFIYLHGFASAPQSGKAGFFAQKVKELGHSVDVPDLNAPDFEKMTLTSQLNVLDSCLSKVPEAKPVVVFGSSMGGLIATLKAQASTQIKAIILLAPGFGLGDRLWDLVGGHSKYQSWATEGQTTVFHYAFNREMQFGYEFAVDCGKYPTSNLRIKVPGLVIHGKNDDVVPVEESIAFHKLNADMVELHVLNSDHLLADVLPEMWQLSNTFLQKHRLT